MDFPQIGQICPEIRIFHLWFYIVNEILMFSIKDFFSTKDFFYVLNDVRELSLVFNNSLLFHCQLNTHLFVYPLILPSMIIYFAI